MIRTQVAPPYSQNLAASGDDPAKPALSQLSMCLREG